MGTDVPTRRHLLASLGAGALVAAVPAPGWAQAGEPAWLGAARAPDGAFVLCGIRADGSLAFRLALPARGHAGAAHPSRALAVVMARRPGTYALVVDCAGGAVMAHLSPPPGIHFNGHAAFLDGGARLATVEQRADDSAGQVGLWDTRTWQRLATWPTGGLGPHEAVALPGGGLAVANGGIATDAQDRRPLNLATMRPALVVLARGAVVERVELPGLQQNSIRHLAAAPDGTVAMAMQWQGDPARAVPLLALWRPGGAPILAEIPETEALRMQGYAGSVAWSGDGARVAITSPRGGCVQVFDAAGGFLGARARPDVCGLAPHPDGGLIASDGTGALIGLGPDGARLIGRHDLAWDNHLVAVG